MSTKTTIKRVALVAAVALTLGGFSAVSASATTTNTTIYAKVADGLSSGGATDVTAAGVAGPVNTVTLGTLAGSKDLYITLTGAGATFNKSTNFTLNTAGTAASIASADLGAAITINTPTVGSITVNVYTAPAGTGIYTASTETVVFTVAAAKSSGVYSAAKSSVYIVAGDTNTVASKDATVSVRSDATDAAATIQVKYRDSLGSAMPAESLTATVVSGPGVVTSTSDTNTGASVVALQYSVSANFNDAGNVNFQVWANGQVGVSTVVVKNSAGTVLATKTLTFASTTAASLAAATVVNYVSSAGSGADDVIEVTVKDAGGNVIPSYTVSASADSSNTIASIDATAVTDATGVAAFHVTPSSTSSSGAAKFNFTDSTTKIKASATTNISAPIANAIAITTDVTSAAPGDKVTYTLTATDAAGLPVADGSYTFFAAKPTVSAALGSNPFDSTTVTLVDGKATSVAYASAYTGNLIVSWKTAGTAGTASGDLSKAITGTTISTTVAVTGSADSSLAIDAANAATDAANAAAEEASNATEAASEALAAVNSLATKVASLIAGIKSQLTALTALVKKLQK